MNIRINHNYLTQFVNVMKNFVYYTKQSLSMTRNARLGEGLKPTARDAE